MFVPTLCKPNLSNDVVFICSHPLAVVGYVSFALNQKMLPRLLFAYNINIKRKKLFSDDPMGQLIVVRSRPERKIAIPRVFLVERIRGNIELGRGS